jgi:PAS domain S-box-containing protein
MKSLKECQSQLEEAQRLVAECSQRTSELETVLASVSDYLWSGEIDTDGTFSYLFYSPVVEKITGRPPEFYLGGPERWLSTIHPDDQARLVETSRRIVLRQSRREEEEYRIVHADGSIRWVRDSVTVTPIPGGRFRVNGVVSDISPRREAADSVHAREQEFRAFVENSPDQIIRYDRQFRRTYVNPAVIKAYGLPAEAFIGKPISASAAPLETRPDRAEITEAEARLQAVFDTGCPIEDQITWPAPKGRRNFAVRIFPELDRDGVVTHVWAIGRDITELKQAERRLEALTENSPDLIARFDCQGRYLYVNRAAEKLTRVPAEQVVGKFIGEVLGDRLGPMVEQEFRALRRAVETAATTGAPVEIEFKVPRPAGERIFNVRLIPERDEAGRIVSVLHIGREVTEQKRAEAALRESEQRFRQVTETIDEVFWLTDLALTEMIYISPAYEKVWGRTCASLYQTPHSWLDAIHPEDRDRVRAAMMIDRSRAFEVDYRIVQPSGAVRWIHDRAFPIFDGDGKVYRIAGVAEDITVRRQLEDQFRQAQKLEAVGQLAGGIAHDFNNILTAFRLDLVHMKNDQTLAPRHRQVIEELELDTQRAASLVRQLLLFSRQNVTKMRSLDLAAVLANCMDMLRRLVGDSVTIELQASDPLPQLEGDAMMIEQVLMNLCLNARDAMSQGGRVTIALEPVEVSPDHVRSNSEARTGAFVRLEVADTGCGMNAATLEHIFEPFFTTKEPGSGTGLGLATAFGIVKQHRGWIEVKSAANEGTTFSIYLPIRATADSPVGRDSPDGDPQDTENGIK